MKDASSTVPQIKQRFEGVELVRVFSACGVIWFHLPEAPYKKIAYSGLVCFLIISSFFLAKGNLNFYTYLKVKSKRILVPFTAWFCIYAAINFLRGKSIFPYGSVLASLFAGPWIGLWYLPFLMVVSLIIFPVIKYLKCLSDNASVWIWSLGGFTAFVIVGISRSQIKAGPPWDQWIHAAASVPIGVALHHLLRVASFWRLLTSVIVFVALCCWIYVYDPGLALSYGLAVILCCVAFLFKGKLPYWTGFLGSLCLGVYLVHGILIGVSKFIPFIKNQIVLQYIFVIVVSFIITFFFKKIPYLNKIV